ncbi:CU044_2847 family protein [Streptomyces sp. NPDC014894]|uniref:CU044_2847 family protein n=1 Tax=Streptomyces sp. NPDC014894 TaxID=3364931 RepID=UPI0037003433
MTRVFVEIPSTDGPVAVFETEQESLSEELQLASETSTGLTVRAGETLSAALSTLRPALNDIRNSLAAVSPDAVEVEFGIKVGGESGVIFAKGTVEANFVVRLSWDRSDGRQ